MIFATPLALLGLLVGVASANPVADVDRAPDGVHSAVEYAGKAGSSGRWASGFTVVNDSHAPVHAGTRFRLALGGEHLYFLAEASEPVAGEPITRHTGPDGQLWKDDSLELFIQTGPDPSSAFQLILNAAGEFTGRRLLQFGIMSQPWSPRISVDSRIIKGGWAVAAAIPLADLSPDPKRREWRVQVARNRPGRKGVESQVSVWAPSTGGLQDFATFGTARLPDVDLSEFAWELSDAGPARIVRSENGRTLERRVALVNKSPAYRTVILESVSESSGLANRCSLGIAPGRTTSVVLRYDLGERTSVEEYFSDRVLAGKKSGRTLAARNAEVRAAYEPWRIELRNPGYRSTIFASQNLNRLDGFFHLLDDGMEVEKIEVKLTGDGKSLPGTIQKEAPGRWAFSIDGIAPLAPGIYQLELHGTSGPGEFTAHRTIYKVEKQDGEVWIDANGVVHRNGKPLAAYGFIFGSGSFTRHFPDMHGTIFGPVYPSYPLDEDALRHAIERNAKIGLLSFVYVPPAFKPGTSRGPGEAPLTDKDREAFRALTKALFGNPNVVGYYLWDEPELHAIHSRRLREIYDILRENDPYKPVIILNNTAAGVRDYIETCDISMPDPYVWFIAGAGSALPMGGIGTYLDGIPLGTDSFRARWITPQAFDGEYFGRAGNRGPTAEEMRTQQTLALIHGVTGIVWYPSYLSVDEPGVKTSITYLSREFRWLFDWRVNAPPRRPASVTQGSAAFLDGGSFPILLAANPAWTDTSVTIRDDLFRVHRDWVETGTKKTVRAEEGKLSLDLSAYQSGVFVPAGAEIPTELDWNSVLQKEENILAAAKNPKNIAHRENGGIARLIRPSGNVSRIMAFVDGINIPPLEGGRGYHAREVTPDTIVEVDFSKNRRPRIIRIHHSNILDAECQIRSGGEWKKAGALAFNSDQPVAELNLNGSEADAVRLIINKTKENRLIIHEIEVFE